MAAMTKREWQPYAEREIFETGCFVVGTYLTPINEWATAKNLHTWAIRSPDGTEVEIDELREKHGLGPMFTSYDMDEALSLAIAEYQNTI